MDAPPSGNKYDIWIFLIVKYLLQIHWFAQQIPANPGNPQRANPTRIRIRACKPIFA